jgi:hypothetical protein
MITYIRAELITFPLSGKMASDHYPKRIIHTINQISYSQLPYAVIGETLYWLEADLDSDLMPRNARRNAANQIIEAPLSLYQAPLRGGPPERILDGLPIETEQFFEALQTPVVIGQLAGDLRPDASMAQRIATGFHRNTLINQEGGIDLEQFRVESIVDRVNTTGSVWLGLTVGCAECHVKPGVLTQSVYRTRMVGEFYLSLIAELRSRCSESTKLLLGGYSI